MNPDIDDAENFEHDLRTLIKKKIEMFPEIKKAIIDAMIEPLTDSKYRISIASTDDREMLRKLVQKYK